MCVNGWVHAIGVCVYECACVCVSAYACTHGSVWVYSYMMWGDSGVGACTSVDKCVFALSYRFACESARALVCACM